MTIALSPHNDDSELFLAFTLMREKPLVIVCTDGFIQGNRGDPITWLQRRNESLAAAKILGVEVIFLGIKDTELTYENLKEKLLYFKPDKVYAPAVQGGNAQHDLVGQVATSLFPNVIQYTTYTKTELWTKGSIEIIPTSQELNLKHQALQCYQSQLNLAATRPHFEAVLGRSEWYV
jgi:LmbE family N-acetylglucosaminyl deacetylase